MTTYIIPNNTYLAQVVVKSSPGLPDSEVLPLGVAGPFPAVRGCFPENIPYQVL